MNTKRWVLAGIAAAVVVFILDMIVHGYVLKPLYDSTASVWRPCTGSCSKMWIMMLGQVAFGFVFAGIYTKGYEAAKPGLEQGLRYGFLISLLVSIAYIGVWYVVLPIPFALAAGWVLSAIADCFCAGAVVGLIYRNA